LERGWVVNVGERNVQGKAKRKNKRETRGEERHQKHHPKTKLVEVTNKRETTEFAMRMESVRIGRMGSEVSSGQMCCEDDEWILVVSKKSI